MIFDNDPCSHILSKGTFAVSLKDGYSKQISSYTFLDMSGDGKRSLVFDGVDNMIKEFDRNKNILTNIVWVSKPDYVKYVPEKNEISFIKDKKLILFDRSTQTSKPILDDIDGYSTISWDKDGNSLLFFKHHNINRINIESGVISLILQIEANDFISSSDNKYVAYHIDREQLLIKDLETHDQWKYKGNSSIIRFSPDGNYLAILRSSTALSHFPSKLGEIVVVDYKRKKVSPRILEEIDFINFMWE
ncbi:hypothetical protein [Paenibacillus sp. N3.4]|uniref:hypothetical protein n=1 Tax=Paenibacillus sp. N3.4 TaxID=2603222 RepID=UPI001C9CA9FC|nr:hypothetical protein [Paenibacillus sp. N3.4]